MPGVSETFRGGTRLQRRWQAEIADHVISVAWSPSGKILAAAAVSGPVTLFDVESGKTLATLTGHSLGTTALSWRRDGSLLASAGQDGKVRLWDGVTGEERAALAGGAAWVERVTWHPSADVLATPRKEAVRSGRPTA